MDGVGFRLGWDNKMIKKNGVCYRFVCMTCGGFKALIFQLCNAISLVLALQPL